MIIPAIDLINGQTVRLFQGNYGQQTTYQDSPFEIKAKYAEQGAQWLHLVDLDGAKDEQKRQTAFLKALIEYPTSQPLNIQVGGGIRSEQDLVTLFELGADRVVIGSLAIRHPQLVANWLKQYGADRIVLALDVNIDSKGNLWLPTHGWIAQSNTTLDTLINQYPLGSIKHVLCTDISKDGTLTGANVQLYQQLVKRYPDIQWQASGGIGSLTDLEQLIPSQVSGVIVGKSLLEGQFSLAEAIACWSNA